MRQLSIFAVIVIIIAGVLSGCAPKVSPTTSPPATPAASSPTATAPSSPTPMASEEAVAWGKKWVFPAIDAGLHDPVPGIRSLMRQLVSWAKSGKVLISMDTSSTGSDPLALTKWERRKNKPDIYLNTEGFQLVDRAISPPQLQDLIVAVLCHETFHLEIHMPGPNDPKGSSSEGKAIALEGEAKAWARTATVVIRPMKKAGRYVSPKALEIERVFATCGNHENQRWRDWVKANCVE